MRLAISSNVREKSVLILHLESYGNLNFWGQGYFDVSSKPSQITLVKGILVSFLRLISLICAKCTIYK